MKHPLTALLLIPLGSCSGGPLATDAEVEWLMTDSSAADQEFASAAVAGVTDVVRAVQEGVLALGSALEAAGGPAIPQEVLAASEAIAGHAPPEAAQRPDPEAFPGGGIDWTEILALAITAFTGSAGAIVYRALDHRRSRKAKQLG